MDDNSAPRADRKPRLRSRPAVTQTARKSDTLDVAVGRRIRQHRLRLSIPQEALARYLGVSSQQVQKYEMGSSRVGAGRLMQIATRLQLSVDMLFGLPDDPPEVTTAGGDNGDASLSAECHELGRAFEKIKDPCVRRQLLSLVLALSLSAASLKG